MDELVHHCIRELSFDGDIGCNVSRLQDFIVGFYSHNNTHPPAVDHAFCAFVWSIVIQQPTVRVGTLPLGVSSEVYIAPQTSAKRKASAKGEVHVEEAPPALILVENVRKRSLEDLKAEHGEDLRIAVDPETSFAAITGSHIRSPKLSPMVYSALQLITRGREEGITTVELGRKTKYGQKACFYLIKQLLELGLIIKARRGGVGHHSCIHKYFVERSAFWQKIHQEEAKDDGPIIIRECHLQDGTPIEDQNPTAEPLELDFEPVDSRHLSSLPLIKKRIVALLKASQNNIHPSNNLMITIGFMNPTKTDRRFFQTRLRELTAQGVIERVLVPSNLKDRVIKCIRLVTLDNRAPDHGVILTFQDREEEEKEIMFDNAPAGLTEVRANRTIQKQVSDLLEEAGTSGMILSEICGALGNFDKRTIELLLTRTAKSRPPAQLSDLGTADFMESFGRERRHRYYTLAAYKTVRASENLQDTTSYVDMDFSKVGDFAIFNEAVFYDDDETLHYHEDMFRGKEGAKLSKGATKRKNGATEDLGDEVVKDAPELAPKAKRSHLQKRLRVDEDHTLTPPKKRGRPPKHPMPEEGAPIPPKVRGRPPGHSIPDEDAPTPLKQRGRPGKRLIFGEADGIPTVSTIPKSRGRPTKLKSDAGEPGPTDAKTAMSELMQGVDDIVPPPEVLPLSPPECRATTGVSTDRQGTASTTSHTASELEELPGRGSTDRKDDSEVAVIPQRAVDGARADSSLDTDNSSYAQERAIINHASMTSFLDVTPAVTRGKRKISPPTATPSPTKRTRTSTPADKLRTSANISHLRRENEIFRVVQDLGGIVNLRARGFFDAHVALLNNMAQSGKPASAPSGTRLDKKTADATIKNLEVRGRIKVLKTTILSVTGNTRPVCLIYLPDTHQDKINAFLHHLSRTSPTPNIPLPPITTFERPVEFFSEKVLLETDKARARQTRDEAEQHAKQNIKGKVKLQMDNGWGELLQRVHPGSLKGAIDTGTQADRNCFMQSSLVRDVDRWQSEIENTIQEAHLASNTVFAKSNIFTPPCPTGLPPVAANPPEKSVLSLIAQQRPSILAHQNGKKTKTREGHPEDQPGNVTPRQRRPRFHWTREYDELARDASAIVRARCRGGVKMDLSAFDRVFHSIPRRSVRVRLAHLRENVTGEDVYVKRLEDQWYDLWVQHRGTEHLPDEDPQSPSNFDIVNHIEFLRKHVDKNALRVGYIKHTSRTKLPASLDDIMHHFDVLCNATVSPAWDFMWQGIVEEAREKQFLRQSFIHGAEEVPYVTNTGDDAVQITEAAPKITVLGLPTEHCDTDLAATMLHHGGNQSVSLATSDLLRRGVLSRPFHDPKMMKAGRTLKISDVNLNTIGGYIQRDLFQDAVALDEAFTEQVDSMEWPLLASDGDTATLLQLVSDDQVDFTIDVTQSRNARAKLDGNSRKADDDDIETSIQVRLNAFDRDNNEGSGTMMPSSESRSNPTKIRLDESMPHGQTLGGADAACAEKAQSRIVDCVSCIKSAFSEFTDRLDGEEQKLARSIFDRAHASLEAGTSKSDYLTLGAHDVVMDMLQRMSQTFPPLILWVGYSAPVIVSCLYARAWTVEIVREPKTLALPRRWLDIQGGTIKDTWNATLHAVVGIIVFHPGISQTELRWRLRALCDRQELKDVLCSLYHEGAIHARFGLECVTGPIWPVTMDDREEQQVFWFIGKNRHWYHV